MLFRRCDLPGTMAFNFVRGTLPRVPQGSRDPFCEVVPNPLSDLQASARAAGPVGTSLPSGEWAAGWPSPFAERPHATRWSYLFQEPL